MSYARREMTRKWALTLATFLSVVGIGCGGGGAAPPSNVSLDAYIAHNAAVDQQEKWQTGQNEFGRICSFLYKHPGAKEGATAAAISAFQRRVSAIAADACIKGVQLTEWKDSDLDKQLEERKKSARAQRQESQDIAFSAAAKLVESNPEACAKIESQGDVSSLLKMTKVWERILDEHPEAVPPGTTSFDVANAFTSGCIGGPKAALKALGGSE